MRTEQEIAADYVTYRGKCKELCEAAMREDSNLKLVRGHITVPAWPSDPFQPHWWCTKPDGAIVDPSWRQFPFQQQPPARLYEEFNGHVECAECGEPGMHQEFGGTYFAYSNYCFCSNACAQRFVGL